MLDLNPLISLEHISKTFGHNPADFRAMAIKDISVNIHDGEFIIVYGASGSGKSTFLNLIAGLESPTSGRILVRQRNLADFTSEELAQYHRRKIGMVFQNFNLIKSLNVWENVALPQVANGTRYSLRRKRALNLLEIFGLTGLQNHHPNELSGGQQQRVAIARALINNPYLLLIDEPTGNLDTAAADEVMQIIEGLHSQSSHTIVLVTHNPSYLRYATRIFYMQDGQIIKEVRPHLATVSETTMPVPSQAAASTATASPENYALD